MKQQINQLRDELKTDVTATRAAKIGVILSAYWATVNEMLVKAEMNYNEAFVPYMDKYEKMSEAKARSQVTQVYRTVLELHSLSKSLLEQIRAIKYYVKRKEIEFKEATYN